MQYEIKELYESNNYQHYKSYNRKYQVLVSLLMINKKSFQSKLPNPTILFPVFATLKPIQYLKYLTTRQFLLIIIMYRIGVIFCMIKVNSSKRERMEICPKNNQLENIFGHPFR
eukprot:288143_1